MTDEQEHYAGVIKISEYIEDKESAEEVFARYGFTDDQMAEVFARVNALPESYDLAEGFGEILRSVYTRHAAAMTSKREDRLVAALVDTVHEFNHDDPQAGLTFAGIILAVCDAGKVKPSKLADFLGDLTRVSRGCGESLEAILDVLKAQDWTPDEGLPTAEQTE